MTACRSTLTLVAACSLLAVQAHAQAVAPGSAAPAAPALATPALATPASADLKRTVALRTVPAAAATTLVTAAGSVLVLADGIVAHARVAQVQPPAPGFQYER